MLSLSTLHTTLAHLLAPPHLHTAILFTTSGQLISYASDAHDSSFNNNNNYPDSSNSSFTSNTANSTSDSPSSTLKPKSPTKSTSSTSSASEAEQEDADANAVGVTGGALGGSAVSGSIVGGGAIGGKRVAVSRGSRSKDDIRVLVGLGSELWGETKGAGVGMVDSELGRIVVVPILGLPSAPSASASALPSTAPTPPTDSPTPTDDTIAEKKDAPDAPLMLLALNGTDDVSWDKMRSKAKSLATHLAPPLSKYREYLVVAHPPLPLANGVVPPGGSSVSATGGGGGGGRMVVGGRI
ncbi:hypothetical protein BDN71DRAFT_154937 [Pleurotus eryngii]|uniref:Uncharacterized protein n=1 Tax=Pleurotus eryngii TaxID=5323 RepID=A0A9P5ZNH0_PLEER|nr:hypothetical protein BDN71DRAFT_154937 [Pleurotus eryngii]